MFTPNIEIFTSLGWTRIPDIWVFAVLVILLITNKLIFHTEICFSPPHLEHIANSGVKTDPGFLNATPASDQLIFDYTASFTEAQYSQSDESCTIYFTPEIFVSPPHLEHILQVRGWKLKTDPGFLGLNATPASDQLIFDYMQALQKLNTHKVMESCTIYRKKKKLFPLYMYVTFNYCQLGLHWVLQEGRRSQKLARFVYATNNSMILGLVARNYLWIIRNYSCATCI